MRHIRLVHAVLVLLTVTLACAASLRTERRWSDGEVDMIRSLWIGNLGPLPADPSNRYADDTAAAALGESLFFEPRLSGNRQVSCASCHLPSRQFQDDLPLAAGGVGRTTRRTMPIAGTAYSPWYFWDGRKDSQWAQALGPLESAVEHGGTRARYAHVIVERYAAQYASVFGSLPDLASVPPEAGPAGDAAARAAWAELQEERREAVTEVFANVGKAIAAYERRLEPGVSRFDRYASQVRAGVMAPAGILAPDEEAGLRLFIGKANCTRCHNGPRFTDDHFHNTGVPATSGLPADSGRTSGVRQVMADEFNCRSRYSDAAPGECPELDFAVTGGPELVRAFKTPSLRGVADRAPYMHAGQIGTLAGVIAHYDRAPAAPAGHSELTPIGLTRREREQLAAFLRTLDAPVDTTPPAVAPAR